MSGTERECGKIRDAVQLSMKCLKACDVRGEEKRRDMDAFCLMCSTVAVNVFAEMYFIDSARCRGNAEEEPPPGCPDLFDSLVFHSVHALFFCAFSSSSFPAVDLCPGRCST